MAQGTSGELFTNGLVPRIKITIPSEGIKSLRAAPRQYVSASVQEGTNIFTDVAVHLKGSVGSFRGLDGKPALTLSFDRSLRGQRFYSLRKIHLNNSVEDPSYMNELLGSLLFQAAGVPAARVGHAIVELNGRRLGLCVLKEGFTEDFLALHFRHPTGNLYDLAPGGHDVNEPMQKALGSNPDDRSDMDALAQAIEQPDAAQRWAEIPRFLDINRFLSFMAVEILLGHRDGYCLARNNFRIYHDVDSNRLVFLPHGMDVLFGNARAAIEPKMNGLVGRAVMESEDGRKAYRARLGQLYTNIFNVPGMYSRIDATLGLLRPHLSPEEVRSLEREAFALKERISARAQEVNVQLAQPALELVRFIDGRAKLNGWREFDVPEGGSLFKTNATSGRRVLVIQAGPVTAASWRSKALLPPGRYRFEASVKTTSIVPLPFGKNHGAALRVLGTKGARSPRLVGSQPWQPLQVTFETSEREHEVELVCELRAQQGAGWFDVESASLVRLE